MDVLNDALILFGGLWAGTINSIVGSGTLVTFPILLALGYAPVTATMSNAMGLIAGIVSGTWGYRRELKGLGSTLLRLLPASALGGVTGAVLLLNLPDEVFGFVAPFLIVVALGFVVFQPKLQRWVMHRSAIEAAPAGPTHARSVQRHPLTLMVLVYLAGVYGGYFVAAQGILLVGILGVFFHGTMQHAVAMKNVLVLTVTLVATASYMLFALDRIDWWVVLLIGVSSLIGGFVGAIVGRRLAPVVLRSVIVVLGLVALYAMIMRLVG